MDEDMPEGTGIIHIGNYRDNSLSICSDNRMGLDYDFSLLYDERKVIIDADDIFCEQLTVSGTINANDIKRDGVSLMDLFCYHRNADAESHEEAMQRLEERMCKRMEALEKRIKQLENKQ